MIEDKLTAHGVGKVVPDSATLEAMYRRAVLQEQTQRVIDKALEDFSASEAESYDVPEDLLARVNDQLAVDDRMSWDMALSHVVRDVRR